MPNATVRANARTLPGVTNRRAVLSAVLAAGAAGVTAALPAVASAAPALSARDRRVLDLWRRRAKLKAIAARLSEEYDAAKAKLPEWAREGPKYVLPDGSRADSPARSGWPMVADLSRRRVDLPLRRINARPSPTELRDKFLCDFVFRDEIALFAEYGRDFSEFADRLRQQAAEEKRLGLDVLGQRHTAAWDAIINVEKAFDQHIGSSVLALGAVLIIAIEDHCEDIEALNRTSLRAIRPQLISEIAEEADRVLAEAEEAMPTDGEPA